MMRSLYSGVAGLRTHQTKMDVLGNNIANVNTTSFKSQSITFSDLMYQTTQSASGATETKGGTNARQIGLGAKSGAISTAIESQGATQTTNNPFDIMITGKAFFIVNNGKEDLYTRDGSFYVDGAGNLAMQSNGYLVQGWEAKEDKETGEISVDKNGGLTSLQIMSAANSTYSPASTTSALISGNIDDNDSNIVSDDGKTITLEFYDNKGYLYTAKFNIKDTGEDNLFSVELTDIIDSNGTKLPAELFEHISFGNQQKAEDYTKIQEGYYLETSVDATTGATLGTIYQQSGMIAYKDVPGKGDSISALSNIQNFLQKVYPTASTKRYANINSFEIDSDALNVEFKYTDYSSSINNATYKSFVLENKEYWYYDENSHFGYAAPSIDGGKLSSLNTDMLSKVFNLSTTDTTGAKIINDISNYNYSFDDSGVLTVIASKVPEETGDGPEAATKLKQKYDDYFVKSDGTATKVSEFISSINTTTYPKGAYYEYDDTTGVLTIYGGKEVTTATTKNLSITSNTKMFALMESKANTPHTVTLSDLDKTEYADAKAQYTNIVNDLKTAGSLTADPTSLQYSYDVSTKTFTLTMSDGTKTANYSVTSTSHSKLYSFLLDQGLTLNYSDLNANSRAELKTLIDNSDADLTSTSLTFTIRDLTGTTGATATASYNVKSVDASTELTTFNRFSKDYNANAAYTYDVPTVVFRDAATKKTGYVLVDEDPEGFTLDEIPDDILSTIYGVSKDEIKKANMNTYDGFTDDFSKMQDSEFTVTFINGGKISISHIQEDAVPISEDYIAEVQDDGTVVYSTANDIIAFPIDTTVSKTFPLEGYISDILETADSDTKGLLQQAFGISDADARAFGSEGYYVIDEDNGIMLYTSKADMSRANKTIQLTFDPASGKIVSANGDTSDSKKVNMKFDQSIAGLEAFGFQETPGVERETGTIEVDFSTVTNYNTNGSSTIKATKGDKNSLNTGRAVGEMNGVTVSTDGQIYATYSNGQTKLLGQIASAEFANASGLSKEGDNLYSSTLNSGDPTVQDITTDGGYMNTGVLEMSNVDLSKEFTEMITTQRGFQANSRIITVSDTLLEELTNLKR